MFDFFLNLILWTCAIYGLIEIIKNIYYTYTCTNLKTDGVYIIVACKNQEKKIEAYLRSVIFRMEYGKEENIKDIIVTDLNSEDKTLDIMYRLQKEYKEIKVLKWKDCIDIIDNINT